MTWVAYLSSIGYSMEDATWINIDETAIPYHVGGRAGMRKQGCSNELLPYMVEKASLGQRRGHCTFMAAIASNPIVQKVLLQQLLPNIQGQKKKWKQSEVLERAPETLHVDMDTGGWSTIVSMRKYIDRLKASVDKTETAKVVLVMDCHPSHYAFDTLRHVTRKGWKVLLVPSKLTWLLQPLDAYFFAQFKHHLNSAHAAQKMTTPDGVQTFEAWLDTTISCIHTIFGSAQARASFEKCGATNRCGLISEKIMRCLDTSNLPGVRKLTECELHEYIGVKKKGIHALMFNTRVPEHAKHMPALIPKLTRRFSSKRSFDEVV